jgi:hypothetical protein
MTEPSSADDWPSAGNKIADTDYVHAIGQISLVFNLLEDVFNDLFQLIFPADIYTQKRYFTILTTARGLTCFRL